MRGYLIEEYFDRVAIGQVTIEHASLRLEVPWYRDGVYQGTTTVGPKGFLLSDDKRWCLIITPEEPRVNWVQLALIEGLRARLAQRGWSQGTLARRAGITEKHMSQLLNGKTQGTLAVWSRLLRAVDAVIVVVDE